MADLQEQLQAILGDPQAMEQITTIARTLTGGAPSPQPAAQDVDFVPVAAEASPPVPGAPEEPPAAALGALGELDPRVMQIALRVFSEYSAQDDDKVALLTSLRPFLRPERREKLEKAASIARLSRVVRLALELLREEGGHV